MPRFLYSGPMTTTKIVEGKALTMIPGREYELPEDHAFVRMLRARGRLVPAKTSGESKRSKAPAPPEEKASSEEASPRSRRSPRRGAESANSRNASGAAAEAPKTETAPADPAEGKS